MHSVLGPRQCVRACECNPQRCYLVTSRRALFTAYMRRDCEPRGTRPPADVLASSRRAGACGVSLSCDARVAPLLVLPPPSFFPVNLTCVPPPSCTEDRERYWTELPSRLRLQAKYLLSTQYRRVNPQYSHSSRRTKLWRRLATSLPPGTPMRMRRRIAGRA